MWKEAPSSHVRWIYALLLLNLCSAGLWVPIALAFNRKMSQEIAHDVVIGLRVLIVLCSEASEVSEESLSLPFPAEPN